MGTFEWVVVGLVVAAVLVNIAAAKGWIPGFSAASLDGVAVKLAALLAKVKGTIALTYAGRQAIRTIMLFVMVCLETLPDGEQKDKCKEGARNIDSAFFDPPHAIVPGTKANLPTDSKVVKID
jgi:hypothetical protein